MSLTAEGAFLAGRDPRGCVAELLDWASGSNREPDLLRLGAPGRFPNANSEGVRGVKAAADQSESRPALVTTDGLELRARAEAAQIIIRGARPGHLSSFLETGRPELPDLLLAAVLGSRAEDYLWLVPRGDERAWALALTWETQGSCRGMLAPCSQPAHIDKSYWCCSAGRDRDEREQHCRKLFLSLTSEGGLALPRDFPFTSSRLCAGRPRTRRLTIKVEPSLLWFLRYPVDHFCRAGYGGFAAYRETEWILTREKGFLQNARERALIERELQDVRTFLKHAVVVLNSYGHWGRGDVAKKWQRGLEAARKVLPLLQRVHLGDETLFLRWYLNPSSAEVEAELRNPDTWYFFANFHAEEGEWRCGERVEGSSGAAPCAPTPNYVGMPKEGELSHIRLMRVFHCHSVFDSGADRCGPAIVPSLLRGGAMRVEGSIEEENALDHLCSLLYLFTHSQGLAPILFGKCLESGREDFAGLCASIDAFLETCGWSAPSPGC